MCFVFCLKVVRVFKLLFLKFLKLFKGLKLLMLLNCKNSVVKVGKEVSVEIFVIFMEFCV